MNSPSAQYAVDDPELRQLIRVIAMVLAVGASLWGTLLAIVLLISPTLLGFVVFAPGYLVTLGYFVRATQSVARPLRRGIWSLSILVQGTWSLVAVWGILQSGWDFAPGPVFIVSWWWLTTGLSAVCLMLEPADANIVWDSGADYILPHKPA